jgi:hypothetical protein
MVALFHYGTDLGLLEWEAIGGSLLRAKEGSRLMVRENNELK